MRRWPSARRERTSKAALIRDVVPRRALIPHSTLDGFAIGLGFAAGSDVGLIARHPPSSSLRRAAPASSS